MNVCLLQMLLNLHKETWMDGLELQDFKEHATFNEKTIKVFMSIHVHVYMHVHVCVCVDLYVLRGSAQVITS